MLNTKYIIVDDESGSPIASTNYTKPNGNAWFVSKLEEVANANEEILKLDSLNTKSIAITTVKGMGNKTFKIDSTASIQIEKYKPNYIKYQSDTKIEGFAVFSEIYYDKGWNAYVDGELTPYIRVNYVLRGMKVPSGKHTVEFKFEPQVIQTGSNIALASSIVFMLLILGGVFYGFKANSKQGA